MHTTKNDLAKKNREKLVEMLNLRLADAIDLKTQAKQAHWNVKGSHFIGLHELFDQVATAVEADVDLIAERVTALGGTAMGTARVVARESTLSEYPLEIVDGTAHVDALSTAMADFNKKVRGNMVCRSAHPSVKFYHQSKKREVYKNKLHAFLSRCN